MAFKKGQEVVIKNPGVLRGTIVKRRPGDDGLPEDQALYEVKISEQRYYRSTALEVEEQSEPRLERFTPEWMAELNRS